MRKNKQTILITGAGQRIGAILAEHVARNGYDVALHYHTSARAAAGVAARCTKHGVKVTLVSADLTNASSCVKLFATLPPCTAMIHNASLFRRDTLASMTPSLLRDHIALHIEAPLLLAQAFMKQLPARSEGSIVLIGDGTLGWSIAPQFFSYAASKHSLHALVDVLAAATTPRARVNLIAPGPTLMGEGDTKESFAKLARNTPLKRTTNPGDITQAVDYLLAAPNVTGQTLWLSGGLQLSTFRHGFADKSSHTS